MVHKRLQNSHKQLKINKMTEYTLQSTKEHGFILHKDGEQAFCPFQQPIATQGNYGVQLLRMPCSSKCPLAVYKEAIRSYEINCGSEVKSFRILEESEIEKPSTIIKG